MRIEVCRSGALAALTVALCATVAHADPDPADPPVRTWPSHGPVADQGAHSGDTARADDARLPKLERPFLYLIDPTLPHPIQLVASYSTAYAPDAAGTHPLTANHNQNGLVNELHLEDSVHERIALFADNLLAPPHTDDTNAHSAFNGGIRVLLTNPESHSFHLALSTEYLRDFESVSTVGGRIETSLDIHRLRLAAMTHTERSFAANRDRVDLYAAAGASYRVLDSLRVGAEYVGQDLEGAWESDEAEGGVRHFVGGTLAWAPTSQLLVAAGPAFGLDRSSPDVLGKAQLSYLF